MPRSPWRRIRLASIADGLKVGESRLARNNLRRLDASHGRQDHTVLPYEAALDVLRAVFAHGKAALRASRAPDAAASTATRPTFVTMANAPLVGTGWRESTGDLG